MVQHGAVAQAHVVPYGPSTMASVAIYWFRSGEGGATLIEGVKVELMVLERPFDTSTCDLTRSASHTRETEWWMMRAT